MESNATWQPLFLMTTFMALLRFPMTFVKQVLKFQDRQSVASLGQTILPWTDSLDVEHFRCMEVPVKS